MNGSQIEHYLRRFCGNVFMVFIGVFPSDKLPRFISRPALLVCNTDASHLPGLHWIAIFVDSDGRGEFMDSFGREPGEPFLSFMHEQCRFWTYNDRQLQSVISSYCGHYVCYFGYRRCRGMNMNAIINLFGNDTALNDYLVHKFVCRNKYVYEK